MIGLLDVVALMEDVPEAGLKAGAQGAVVEVFSSSAFEVEFCDTSGRTLYMGAFHLEQLRRVWSDNKDKAKKYPALAKC